MGKYSGAMSQNAFFDVQNLGRLGRPTGPQVGRMTERGPFMLVLGQNLRAQRFSSKSESWLVHHCLILKYQLS